MDGYLEESLTLDSVVVQSRECHVTTVHYGPLGVEFVFVLLFILMQWRVYNGVMLV